MDAPIGGGGGGYYDAHSHSSSLDNLKPSVIVIILILSMTLLISVSLCLLLRHLSRCAQRHQLSPSSTVFSPSISSSADSRRFSVRRVSPEIAAPSILDSLPLFKFSSVTRRSSSEISGDCAVCLSKFEPHDQLRLLPLCCHAFHSECIDTWLVSNQTCPLCRSPLFASESDLMKALITSSSAGGSGENSFRVEIGSISRQTVPESGDQQRSYSIGSFDYIVDEDSEISETNAQRRSISRKDEDAAAESPPPPPFESSLAAEVGGGSRSWLKDYVDRLSRSISSRATSFRSSERFFTGSSRRSEELAAAVVADIEANRAGEEISELFRWISGV